VGHAIAAAGRGEGVQEVLADEALQMKREAPQKLNRKANEHRTGVDTKKVN
jgi:hypothetical protein